MLAAIRNPINWLRICLSSLEEECKILLKKTLFFKEAIFCSEMISLQYSCIISAICVSQGIENIGKLFSSPNSIIREGTFLIYIPVLIIAPQAPLIYASLIRWSSFWEDFVISPVVIISSPPLIKELLCTSSKRYTQVIFLFKVVEAVNKSKLYV